MISRTITLSTLSFVAILTTSVAAAQLPTYVDVQLQARGQASSSNLFNLPAFSSTSGISPAINDNRQVTFKFIDSNFDNPIWAGANGVGGPVTVPYFSTSDPTINAGGELTWRNSISGVTGVYRAPFTGPGEFVTGGFSSYARPEIGNDGTIGFRGGSTGGNQYVVIDPATNQSTVYASEGAEIDFLFTPNYNNNAQMAGKVLLTNGTDELRRFESDGSFAILANDAGVVSGFDNSPDLNDNGAMGFIGNLAAGGRGVGIADDNGVTILADTNNDVDSIAFFSPRMNNNGLVTFRATDSALGEGIYVAGVDGVVRVVGVGDEVMTDQGLAIIDSLSGSPDINNLGDVVFNAGVTGINGNNLGGGVFVALVPEPASFVLLAGGLALAIRRR